MSQAFFNCSLTLFIKALVSHLNPELANTASLVLQLALGDPLSLPSKL